MEWLLAFLEANSTVLSAGGAGVALIAFVLGPVKWLVNRGKKTEVNPSKETIKEIAPNVKAISQLTVTDFIRIRREMKADLEAELATAEDAEKSQLRARIAEMEKQIANPDAALAEAKAQIKDLEARLERMGNEIGGDRLAEARAARLDPSYAAINKEQHFLWRAGRYPEAIRSAEDLVGLARRDLAPSDPDFGRALNNLAECYRGAGRSLEAEPLFREALENWKNVLVELHPDYAIALSNLAHLHQDTGRLD